MDGRTDVYLREKVEDPLSATAISYLFSEIRSAKSVFNKKSAEFTYFFGRIGKKFVKEIEWEHLCFVVPLPVFRIRLAENCN